MSAQPESSQAHPKPFGFSLADCPHRDVGSDERQPHVVHYASWQLKQTGGRVLHLFSLYQYATYAGQLCGLPSAQEHHLQWAVERACHLYAQQIPGGTTSDCKRHIAVLPPELLTGQFVQQSPSGSQHVRSWTALPAICSIARIDSDELNPHTPDANSSVIIVWWQSGYGVPDERATEQLMTMPWESYAWGWMP